MFQAHSLSEELAHLEHLEDPCALLWGLSEDQAKLAACKTCSKPVPFHLTTGKPEQALGGTRA